MGMDTTPDAGLPDELAAALARLGVERRDEVSLRRALEARVPGYDQFRLCSIVRPSVAPLVPFTSLEFAACAA